MKGDNPQRKSDRCTSPIKIHTRLGELQLLTGLVDERAGALDIGLLADRQAQQYLALGATRFATP
jgi:hypothetical protein